MRRWRSVGLILLCFSTAAFTRAGTVDFFGLEHSSIGRTIVSKSESSAGFVVTDLEFTGARGVATYLGAAESGAFFYPTVSSVQTGYFMRGNAYGQVDEKSDAPIGFVTGYRTDYATFFTMADFSTIGATSVTYQVWYANLLVREATVTSGEAQLYAEYSQDVRVNPWWRQANGEYGASIEFGYPPYVSLPDCADAEGCGSVAATRIFIRPNGATSVVHSVSRTEIFGGGGLPSFGFNDVRLGMFGHAHIPIHSPFTPIKFAATNSTLRVNISDPLAEGGSGVLVELDHAVTAEVRLLPLDLARPNTNLIQERLDVQLSGTFSSNGVRFAGVASVENSNGVLRLSAFLNEAGAVAVSVYSNNVPVGTQELATPNTLQITGGPRLVAVGANADMLSSPAGLSFTFDTPAVIHTAQGDLIGDRVGLTATNWIGLADLAGLAVTAQAIPSFTITGETSTSFVPNLSISRSNNVALLRWPDPARAYSVQVRGSFTDDSWHGLESDISYEDGFTTVSYPFSESTALFFRLTRYIYQD